MGNKYNNEKFERNELKSIYETETWIKSRFMIIIYKSVTPKLIKKTCSAYSKCENRMIATTFRTCT